MKRALASSVPELARILYQPAFRAVAKRPGTEPRIGYHGHGALCLILPAELHEDLVDAVTWWLGGIQEGERRSNRKRRGAIVRRFFFVRGVTVGKVFLTAHPCSSLGQPIRSLCQPSRSPDRQSLPQLRVHPRTCGGLCGASVLWFSARAAGPQGRHNAPPTNSRVNARLKVPALRTSILFFSCQITH